MKTIRITMDEVEDLAHKAMEFPKYVSPIINLANQFAQGTRPKVVGQLSEMIQECPYRTYGQWKEWYLAKMPNAILDATTRIGKMIENFKVTLPKINEELVREWVEDLVLVKTFTGLRFQEPILRRISTIVSKKYRLASPEEESRGIDGFVGETSVSIKPSTYKAKPSLMEKLAADVVLYYEKEKDGIVVDITPIVKE